ncbi:class II glutamine amidotransferase [candidate division KSB1 bacterium]|nr:class II glutamine amidotransferase [candidate division KSB1 bacterium]
MCRMILAAGKFEMKPLLDGLVLMAEDRNERHEENAHSIFKHPDGWSIAYKKKNQLEIYKSVKPCFSDEKLTEFESLKSPFVVLHARQATVGNTTYHNVHPFCDQFSQKMYTFFHNGTVREELPISPEYHPKGSTDSERLFYYLLSQFEMDSAIPSYKSALNRLKNYSALNSFFCTADQTFVVNAHSKSPQYYTMKYSVDSDSIIISSEILPGLAQRNWEPLINRSFIQIEHSANIPTLTIDSL